MGAVKVGHLCCFSSINRGLWRRKLESNDALIISHGFNLAILTLNSWQVSR